jgi:hypothetical protein
VLTEVIWLSPEIGISESNPYKKQLFQTLEWRRTESSWII